MSVVRMDALTGETVVLSERRIPAPPAFTSGSRPVTSSCVFCPGHEAETEPTIDEIVDGDRWLARAFGNRRPAFRPEEDRQTLEAEPHYAHSAVGAHEVIVEGRDHALRSLTGERAGLQLAVNRMKDLTGDTRFEAIGWYRNRGVEAGASQPHPHAQVVATAVIPDRLRRIYTSQKKDPALMSRILERADVDQRVLWRTGGLVALCPWAPRVPFEVWFVPLRAVEYPWSDRSLVDDLAAAIHKITGALDAAFGYASLNIGWFFAPVKHSQGVSTWHVRLTPKLVPLAGYEIWSGGGMHPCLPEQSASVLRSFMS